MAPLDTGSVTNLLRLADPFGRGPGPSLADFPAFGPYLRAVREHKGLSLAQVADATRVRRNYLSAIEEGDLAPLPSRPFAVGYVRAYARALGLDGDLAVARFRAEHPEAAQPLRAPVGVSHERDPRRRVLYAGVGALVAAVALWNVAQRSLTGAQGAGPAFPASVKSWPAASPDGPVRLGAPTPPPADQTTPEPYVTPGLDAASLDAAAKADVTAGSPSPTPPLQPVPAAAPASPPPTLADHAGVYGGSARKSGLVIQAQKAAALIVRGPDRAIYFARVLEPGEAYRAPLGRGLTADVSDPTAFAVYMNGKLKGVLGDPQASLDKAAATRPAPLGLVTEKVDALPVAPFAGAAPASGSPARAP